jgi:serine/threonine protein kinase
LEKRLEGVRFLNCAGNSDIAIPGFFLPIKYANNAAATRQDGNLTSADKAVDDTSDSDMTAVIIQGINLQALGWRSLSESAEVKPLQQRLKRWEPQLSQIAAAKPFDIMELNAQVCDLGNACWTTKHFTDDIQTRQYRCPEVIVGKKYDTSADVWSMACFVFELVTGDLLFDPKSGRNFNRDDDHLAQMMELLGRMPKAFTGSQRGAKEFFTRKGDLKHIKSLKFWSLRDVLVEKYRFSPPDAESLSTFLLPMLRYEPAKRVTAEECLEHPWVAGVSHNSDNDSDRE